MAQEPQKDSPLWFLYIYGGFALVALLVYLGKTGKAPATFTLALAMLLSVAWMGLFIYHFFKKRPKKTPQK
ncbi:MAG TPA: hypothetical protein VMU88_03575 [bacterium]|nr:hypothetical protein [bacterium]